MTEYIFVTPTIEEGPAGSGRLFHFYKLNRGITIIRQLGGAYAQIRFPLDSDLDSFPEVYRGGYNHTVSTATRAALIAGGVGVTAANFTAL
jgi:hypothetical protein